MKPQKELPEKVSPYDTSVPITATQAIGYRKDSPNSINMHKLELMMSQHKRKTDIAANYYQELIIRERRVSNAT